MKARDLAEKLLQYPDADVFVTQTMHFESLAHHVAQPIVEQANSRVRLYLFMEKGQLGHSIPEAVIEQRRTQ